jgi:endonuclease-8
MPEGHTIHRLAKDLNKSFRGEPVRASSPQGRFADGAAQLDNIVLEKADAYGKHLFIRFDHGDTLHIHLGLIGKLRPKPAGEDPVGAIRLRLENDEVAWDLSGPMTCAIITEDDRATVTKKLGPDPLRRDGKAEQFQAALAKRKIPIGAAQLDQAVIAGIGNVYRSEFLFLLGIHPDTPSNALTADQTLALWDTAVEQLKLGMRLNRIVTRSKDELSTSQARAADGERLYVYKREGLPCHRCGTEIRISEVAKRSMWHCPSCQPS